MKTAKRMVVFLIISVFLIGLLPTALAEDDENVLTSISHADASACTWSNSRTITLTVRNSYVGPLDLTNGLNIGWDSLRHKLVVATPELASIEISEDNNFEGAEISDLVVTYYMTSVSEGTQQFSTTYQIRAKRADPADAVFSGTVRREIYYSEDNTEDNTVEFTSADFIPKFSNIDGEDIGAIAINGSNPTFGTILVDGESYELNTQTCITINTDLLHRDETIFTFEATSAGVVSYNVSAFAGNDTTHPIGNVVVTIQSYKTPEIHTPISEDLSKGAVKRFDSDYFADRCNLYGVPLEAVVITPAATPSGTWYIGTQPFTAATTIPAGQLGSLTFSANTAGTVTFTWDVTTQGGTSLPGDGAFTITSPKLTLSSNLPVSIVKGNTQSMSLAPLTSLPVSVTFVKITAIPAAGDGYLYLTDSLPKNDVGGYPAIAANKALTTNAIIPKSALHNLRLATKSTSTNPTVSFSWTATADTKASTAVWAEAATYTASFISGGSLPSVNPYYYETGMNIPLPLMSEAIKAHFLGLTGESLSWVTFKLPDKSFGSLYLNYDIALKKGTAVSASAKYYTAKTPNLSQIAFVPTKDYTGTSAITYNAYTESGSVVTGQINIRVTNSAGGTFSYVTDKNSPIQLNAADFQAAFLSATGKELSSVRFSPLSSNDGYLCYDYDLTGDYAAAVTSGSYYYAYKAQYLSHVTFVPYSDKTGPVVINYTGYTENGTLSGSGKLYIYIVDSPAGIVQYSVKANGRTALSADDFSNEFIGVTGSVMSYVTFKTPPVTSGSMFFQYNEETGTGTKVTTAIKYYNGKGPDISDITFVPAKDFTGICVVPFTGYTAGGASYAGKLKFSVFEGTEVISYSTVAGKPVPMASSDFTDAFYINSDGRTLSYVTLELPSATYGRFYYNYTSPSKFDYAVTADRKLYVYSSPYLSNVSFVPSEGYTGTFSVTYTGYTSAGTSFTGKIKITVTGAQSDSISYETNSMTPAAFKAADFVTALIGKTSNPLYYVRFTLPYDSYGTLYYGSSTRVQAASSYYVNYSPSISDIKFVPNPSFSGVLAVSYTAYDTYGYSYTGSVLITVKSSDIGTLTYGTNLNEPLSFDSDDFNMAFLNNTGASLHYVTFTLPPSLSGTLYLGYKNSTSYTSTVSASAKYYRSYSPLLSNVSFVPKTGYSGTVTIPYTGYSSDNSAYYGKIIINVNTSVPYTDMGGHDWAKEAVDYLYRSGIITDDSDGRYNPDLDMSRGDFMVMIASAFHLTGAGAGSFPDVPAGNRYYDAVAAAKAYDIARGDDTGLFHPEWGLTRQDAMVILVRTFKNTGSPLTPGTMSDLTRFSDASEVSDYAVADLAALVRIGFVQGADGRLNPKMTFTRAESAMLLYRILIM